MKRSVRVGVVGAGYVATHHLRALRDLGFAKVVGICDLNAELAKKLAAKFGVEAVYGSLREMAAAQPEVIHVLTPPQSHCALALEAMEMGCHVFVEKPMAESAAECERMIETAQRKGLTLSVNHSARLDPVVLDALERVRSGAIGRVLAVHFIRSSDYPGYAGGKLPAVYAQGSYPFRDLGVHGLYLLESFLGPVRKMELRYGSEGGDPNLTFDEWRAICECQQGTGWMFLSWNTRPMQNELWIHGTRGVMYVDCFLQICQVEKAWPGPKPVQFVLNGMLNPLRKLFRVPLNVCRFATGSLKPSPGIYRSVQDFHRALADGKPVPVPAEEGLRVVRMVEEATCDADYDKTELLRREREKSLPPARVLVTGGGGFLGSALVRRLREQGDSVRLLLRRPPAAGTPAKGLPAIFGSLGDPEIVDRAVEGVDVVYHVGAAMRGGPAAFEEGTIWGTRNVLAACRKHRVKRLMYVSSMGLLDHAGHRTGIAVDEASPLEPFPDKRGLYTQKKLEAEQMVLDAMHDGLAVAILRPGQIFGPGAERVPPNGVFAIAGQWIVAGNGSRRIPLVYVDDVVDGLLAAERCPQAAGNVIHLVDPSSITQKEYLRHCLPAIGGIKVRYVPVWFLLFAAFGLDLMSSLMKRSLPLSRYKIRSLKPLDPVDGTLARAVLGWEPRIGTAEGLRRTFGQS